MLLGFFMRLFLFAIRDKLVRHSRRRNRTYPGEVENEDGLASFGFVSLSDIVENDAELARPNSSDFHNIFISKSLYSFTQFAARCTQYERIGFVLHFLLKISYVIFRRFLNPPINWRAKYFELEIVYSILI
jgi:hypothetical protein